MTIGSGAVDSWSKGQAVSQGEPRGVCRGASRPAKLRRADGATTARILRGGGGKFASATDATAIRVIDHEVRPLRERSM